MTTRQIIAPLPRDHDSARLVKALRAALPEGWCVWSSRSGSVGCNRGSDLPDLHITRTDAGWAFDGAAFAAEDAPGVRARVLGVVARRANAIQKSATNQESK